MKSILIVLFFSVSLSAQLIPPNPGGGGGATTPSTTAPICGAGAPNSTQACNGTPIVTAIGANAVQNATHATAADSATTAGTLSTPLAGSGTFANGPAATNSVLTTAPFTGAVQRTQNAKNSELPSFQDFGLIPDLVHMDDAAMTSGSGLLTTAHTFVSGDVGKTCVVGGAGTEGPGNNLRTTIVSVASGHATLTATATNTVSAQLADCGTLNNTFPVVQATKGSGFVIPSGSYLIDNSGGTGNNNGIQLQFWTGTIQFATGASVVCVDAAASGFPCVGGDQATNVTLVNPVIGYAGNTVGTKTNGAANGISFTKGTNIIVQSPTINSTGAGTCFVDVNNVNLSVTGTLTMNECNLNGFYSVSSQDTALGSVVGQNIGDYEVEVDTETGAGFNANATGFSAQGIHCKNVYGCVLFDGKQKATVSDIEGSFVCGGVNLNNGFGATKDIDIGKIVIDNSGNEANANWPGCTVVGSGSALQVTGTAGAHIGSARFTATNNSPLVLVSSPYISIDTLSYSGITSVATKPLLIAGNTIARINNFHVDTSTVNIVAGVSPAGVSPIIGTGNAFLFGQFWDFQNVCTLGGCSGNALSLPTNAQFNINSIVLNDSQPTPTGYRVQSTGTTAQSTINNVQGLVPSGAPTASVDTNTCLDCASFAQASTITLNGVGNPTANKTFVFPNTQLSITGTAPAAVSGAGTAGASILSVTSIQGGDTTGTTGQTAGNGGGIGLFGGIGGGASTGSINGNGGSVTINGGAAGSGTGTAGSRGNVFLQTSGGQVVVGTGTASSSGAAFYVSTSAVGMEVNRSGSGGILALDFNGTRTAQIVALTGGGGKLANASNSSTSFQWDGSGNSFFGTAQQGEIDASGRAVLPAVSFTGTAPTIANGAAAGTSPGTPTVTGFNQAGVITVITGTATTTGTLATVTFNGTLATAPQGCQITPRNAATAPVATALYTTAPSTTTWTLAAATALTISTTYSWSYNCF